MTLSKSADAIQVQNLADKVESWLADNYLLAIVVIVLVSAACRGTYLLELRGSDLFAVVISDSRSYDDWAKEISGGEWFGNEVFYQAPLYPYFLASIYSMFGRDLFWVRVVQATLAVISCVLLADAGRRFFQSALVATLAGMLLAIYPVAIFFDGLIQKTSLAIFLLCLMLWLLSRAISAGSILSWALTGCVAGLLCLTRENAIVFAGCIVLWIAVTKSIERIQDKVKWSFVFVAGMLLILLPIAFRNNHLGGGFQLTTSQLGPNLFIGNNVKATGSYSPLRTGRGDPRYERHDARQLAEQALGRSLSPGEVSSYWVSRVREFAISKPGKFIGLLGKKAQLMVNVSEATDAEAIEVYARHSFLLNLLWHVFHFGVLVPLGAIGLAFGIRKFDSKIGLLMLLLLGYAGTVVTFYVFSRYRFPLVPFAILFSAYAVRNLLCQQFDWRNPRAILAATAIVGLVIFCNVPAFNSVDSQATTYNNVGTAFAIKDQRIKARSYFEKTLELKPDSYLALSNLAGVQSRDGELQAARKNYKKAIELQPDYAAAHNHYANLLAHDGNNKLATEHFLKAIQLNPKYVGAITNMGNMLARMGNQQGAIRLYKEALAIDPDYPDALENLKRIESFNAQ